MPRNRHSLIIDTTLYAGNFERPLCAWLTGQVGECGVGDEVATRALPTLRHADWWESHVVQKPDENGCHRPVAIAATPGFSNDGMGGHYEDTEEGRCAALPRYHAAMRAYHAEQMRNLERVEVGKFGWTDENLAAERGRLETLLETALLAPEVQRYPAYQSVEIFLDAEIPDDVLAEVHARLKKVEEDPYGTGVFRSYGSTHQPAKDFKVLGLRSSHVPAPVSRVHSL